MGQVADRRRKKKMRGGGEKVLRNILGLRQKLDAETMQEKKGKGRG